MNLEIIKVISHTNLFGDIDVIFYSMTELNKYKNNPYVNSVTIVEHYTNLTLEQFDELRKRG